MRQLVALAPLLAGCELLFPTVGDDGGAPAGDGPIGSTGWCSRVTPVPTFCADFDEGVADYGWTSTVLDSAGMLGLDPNVSRSMPASLFAQTTGTMGNGKAALLEQFGAPWDAPTSIRLEVDVRLDSTCTTVTIASIQRGDGTRIRIDLSGTPMPSVALGVMSGSGQSVLGSGQHVVVGTWARVGLVMGMNAEITVDGVSAVMKALNPPTQTGAPSIQIGLFPPSTSSNDNGCSMHFDNLVVNLQR